jgi:hypothetical protein
MRKEFLLGFTKNNEVVFANIENERGYFSASFDTSYPMAIGYDETIERIQDLIEQMDKEWILNKLEYFDCKPSELADKLYSDTYDHVSEFFDNSLYTESFDIEGIDETIYFLASGCGQHDTRNEMGIYINTDLYNYLHELWDQYHLAEIPQEKLDKLVEAVDHQLNTIDEETVIQKWLERTFNK